MVGPSEQRASAVAVLLGDTRRLDEQTKDRDADDIAHIGAASYTICLHLTSQFYEADFARSGSARRGDLGVASTCRGDEPPRSGQSHEKFRTIVQEPHAVVTSESPQPACGCRGLPPMLRPCPPRQGHHLLRPDRRGHDQEALPGDPVHAGRDRRGGASARTTPARRSCTSTRATTTARRRGSKDTFAADHGRDQGALPGADQLVDRRRGPDAGARRAPRAAPARRRAQHGLDELREVERARRSSSRSTSCSRTRSTTSSRSRRR